MTDQCSESRNRMFSRGKRTQQPDAIDARDLPRRELESRRESEPRRKPAQRNGDDAERRGRKPINKMPRSVRRVVYLTPAEAEKLQRDYQASGKPSLNQYVLWNLGL